MIRERGMIPGLATHMPETLVYADDTGLDVETCVSIFNSAGFLMQIEVDWTAQIIAPAAQERGGLPTSACTRRCAGPAAELEPVRGQAARQIGTSGSDESILFAKGLKSVPKPAAVTAKLREEPPPTTRSFHAQA